jgi:hypothetical protein
MAIPSLSTKAPDPVYNLEQFICQMETGTHKCPQGNFLYTNGSWYNKRGIIKSDNIKPRPVKNVLPEIFVPKIEMVGSLNEAIMPKPFRETNLPLSKKRSFITDDRKLWNIPLEQ